jgi:hypothetical protein
MSTPTELPYPEVNEPFAEFAACFVGTQKGDGEIAHAGHLDRSKLDYTVESLRAVDAYLTFLHQNRPEQMDRDWGRAVLWGGAYVGEVVRRHAPQRYDWVDFDDFVQVYPNTRQILGEEKRLGWCALLTPGRGGFTLPINKLLRFIYDGPEDSVHFYAACEVRPR